jgi:ATP-binding protein involved in chromosome partitioning
MSTQDLLLEALSKVNDPELHRSITELGMVQDVSVSGTTAKLHILLTISGCPMKDRLRKDIDAAATSVPSITSVEIEFGVMNEEQRANIKKLLRNGREAFISFAQADSLTRVIEIGRAHV